nr:MAG TPA: hypothetical protein [Bacteriophage sp.]
MLVLIPKLSYDILFIVALVIIFLGIIPLRL